ncbi:hypothetical protein H0E86_30510 [Streptomyces sp. SCSIO-PteL053]|nr:hypothetical protein H0E86_30510 [Streptomyces sp. SCSIO-PteL053]
MPRELRHRHLRGSLQSIEQQGAGLGGDLSVGGEAVGVADADRVDRVGVDERGDLDSRPVAVAVAVVVVVDSGICSSASSVTGTVWAFAISYPMPISSGETISPSSSHTFRVRTRPESARCTRWKWTSWSSVADTIRVRI